MDNQAITNLERLLEQGQDSALLRFGLGSAYLQAKEYQQAADHLSIAVEFDPDYSAAWKLYGKALMALDERSTAHQAFEQGIKVAEKRGDVQAVKEMQVFLRRLEKAG